MEDLCVKSKKKAIIAVFLVLVILVGVAVVSFKPKTQETEEKLNKSNLLSEGNTPNDILSKEYTLKLENEYLQFWMNEDTTEFKVVNKVNASQWYSSNIDREDGSSQAAPISLSYLNSKGSIADMNVMTDSVAQGKYAIEQEENKITVRYSVGEFSELSLVPYALTEERFKKFTDNLEDEFDKMKLTDLYYLTDINIIEDAELKKERLKDYPLLAEQKLYIIRDTTREDSVAKKDIAQIFVKAGYTEKDYRVDSRYFNADEKSKAAPGFNIKVEYTLEGKKLNVCIPHDGIEMYKEFPLTSVTFAPYFGSPKKGAEGWYLLPDGSGSIMNFYNDNTVGKIYTTSVYGKDLAVAERENISSDIGASLPIFGIRRDGCGVLCEIVKGDAISEINAYSGDNTDSSYVNAKFNVRSIYKTAASTGRKESYIIVQKGRYADDIVLEYNFLDSKDVTLSDMASIVRKSIFGESKGNATEKLPVRLNLVGLVTRRNQFLGIGYNEKVCLTDFKKSIDITNTFIDSGINNLSLVLTGWFGDGVDHEFLSGKVAPSNLLGGEKDFNKLIEETKNKNVSLYLDADVQYTAKNSLFDGFSKNSDTAIMLDKSTGKIYEYDAASFVKKPNDYKFINNASAQKKAMGRLIETADKYGIKGISLRKLGSDLSADYNTPNIDRQAMADKVAEQLSEIVKSNYEITTGGANKYILSNVDNITDVPVTSGGSDTTDMSVPFLQMVLSGNVDYFAPTINLSGDMQTALLNAVSTGSGISCTLTAENNDILPSSEQNYLYSTNFDYWKEKLIKQIYDIQNRLDSVAGHRITGYDMLAQGVYKTVYDNGAEVIVNYNSEPFIYEGITVSPKDFSLKGDSQ